MKYFTNISIHAPAKGATQAQSKSSVFESISIHAPAKGATASAILPISAAIFQSTLPRGERRLIYYYVCHTVPFQSTLPRGERPCCIFCSIHSISISIHAPARGATHKTQFGRLLRTFQSTLPRGERPNICSIMDQLLQFQSTLPRGERLGWERIA